LNTNTDLDLSETTDNYTINGRLGSNMMIVNPCYRDLYYKTSDENPVYYYKTYPIYP